MNNIYIYSVANKIDIPDVESISIDTIDSIEANSIEILYLQDLLDTLSPSDQAIFFSTVKPKLKPNAIVYIQAPDLKKIGIAIAFDKIDTQLAQMILYKDKLFIHNRHDIKNIMENNGFKIISQKYINMFEYHIVCIYAP